MSEHESSDQTASKERDFQRYVTDRPNALMHAWRVRDSINGPLLGPLRIMINYVVIRLCHHLPSFALKRWLLRRLGMKLGKNVMITPGVWFDYLFPELITIDENTIIGEEAAIATHEFLHQEYHVGPVHIGRDCLIGGRAAVLCGVRIGDGATVSAMTLVHKHVPPGAFALGVPMKILRGQPDRGREKPPAEPSPDALPMSV